MRMETLKRIVKKNKALVPIYKLCLIYLRHLKNKKKERGISHFLDKGFETMIYVQSVLLNNPLGVDFFFAFGTALGIVRDGKLLGHDMDLDIIVFTQNDIEIVNFRKLLEKRGFNRLHSYEVIDVGITQDAFEYNGIMIDINYAKRNDDIFYSYLLYDLPGEQNNVIIFPFSAKSSILYDFCGEKVNIPANAEKYLEETYGNDWAIPNSNYIYWENECAIKTDLKGKAEITSKYKYC